MGTEETPDARAERRTKVRRWLAREIAALLIVGVRSARGLIAQMTVDGVGARRGAYWYAREADIDTWLTGQWTSPTASAVNTKAAP